MQMRAHLDAPHPKTPPDMMHLDPRPMNPDELSFQDEARLMAYLREVASEREFGPKKQRDLDFQERRASDIWHSARFDFIPDRDKEYEVVCKRMDWFHGLYQLAGEEHVHRSQVSSWDSDWEKVPFPGCKHDMEYEPMYGDHSPFRKEEFNGYRHVHFWHDVPRTHLLLPLPPVHGGGPRVLRP